LGGLVRIPARISDLDPHHDTEIFGILLRLIEHLFDILV
jgi:hypothetical protein